ncbi:MAG TPA: amidohydrolase family protein [Candidatus Dormibacteraeota bacterium]|nr:amidohydrolase family protein [Candidatus Dormibacteraeota bacterium]
MRKLLLHGATILTMDPRYGDLRPGDILIEGNRIAAIAPKLDARPAETEVEQIDASAFIIIPGLINAHMHTWQTGLRAVSSNWTLLEYFRWMHAGLATRFLPDDIRIANLAGALNQMNCGVTTLVDWCHNNPTPAHTDAAIDGLRESGIRAAFFHGSPKPDPKPGERHFSEVPHPRSEVERLLRGPFASREQLLTLGLAILGPHYSTLEVSLHDFRLARELGLIASMHQGGGAPKTPGGWDALERENLVGDHVNIVHGNDLADDQLARFVETGVSFSISPENEMAQGHGHPITGRLRRLGAAPSLGIDLESVVSGDLLTSARIALAHQRSLDNARARAETGSITQTTSIPVREALEWITIAGARMLRMDDRIGSLAPGKQADLVLIRATDLNVWPVHDPVATVVIQASLANIDSVMIAGKWRKRAGKLTYANVEGVKHELLRSGTRILTELGWTPDLQSGSAVESSAQART